MKLKMALLEQAHGLLCNAPGDGTSAEDGEVWRKLRDEWIEQWSHVIRAQQVKEHNRRIAVGNEAIEDYQAREQEAERNARNVAMAGDDNWVAPAGRVQVKPNGAGVLCWPDGTPVARHAAVIWHSLSRISAAHEDYMAAQAER